MTWPSCRIGAEARQIGGAGAIRTWLGFLEWVLGNAGEYPTRSQRVRNRQCASPGIFSLTSLKRWIHSSPKGSSHERAHNISALFSPHSFGGRSDLRPRLHLTALLI